MNFFKTALFIFNGALVVATMLLALSRAEDEGPLSSPYSPALLFEPLLNFGKLRETVGSFDWNDYLPASSRGDKTSSTPGPTSAPNNDSYLDPNGPNVQFILFRRDRPLHHYNMKVDDREDFRRSGLNLSHPTKIIVHGFLSSTKEDVFVLNRDAYLATGDYNVIGMDWSVLCEFEYFTAMRGAQIAGAALGAFVNFLAKEGVALGAVHLVGHSLGAHVCAMGADKVRGGRVGRISGLDPAGPGYSDVPPVYRLDPSDATLVDVVHTNVRVLSLPQPQGHLDFYPNGGRFQPGCPDMYDIWTLGESVECNHGRAYRYFAESIRNKGAFRSYRCPNVESANTEHCLVETDVHMGQEDTYEYGLYYLKTNSKPPFSLS